MKLDPKSWYARFYKHIYGVDDLPLNFCPFFWRILLAMAFMPFAFPAYFHKEKHYFTDENMLAKRSGIALLFWICIFLLAAYIRAWIMHTQRTAVGSGIVVGAIAIAVGFVFLREYIKNKKSYVEKRPEDYDENGNWVDPNPGFITVVKRGFKAWYEKNCPRIEWKEPHEEL